MALATMRGSLSNAAETLRRGTFLGAVGGAAAGLVWNALDPPKSQAGFLQWGPRDTGVRVGRLLFTTAGGTLVGTAVGYSLRRWKKIYPATPR